LPEILTERTLREALSRLSGTGKSSTAKSSTAQFPR